MPTPTPCHRADSTKKKARSPWAAAGLFVVRAWTLTQLTFGLFRLLHAHLDLRDPGPPPSSLQVCVPGTSGTCTRVVGGALSHGAVGDCGRGAIGQTLWRARAGGDSWGSVINTDNISTRANERARRARSRLAPRRHSPFLRFCTRNIYETHTASVVVLDIRLGTLRVNSCKTCSCPDQ